MTVKVIDEGPDPSVIKRIVCNKCGVVLQYVPLDIKERSASYYDGSTDLIRYINCPKCDNEIEIHR